MQNSIIYRYEALAPGKKIKIRKGSFRAESPTLVRDFLHTLNFSVLSIYPEVNDKPNSTKSLLRANQ